MTKLSAKADTAAVRQRLKKIGQIVKPGSKVTYKSLLEVASHLRKYARSVTHIDTGALSTSHYVNTARGYEGEMSVEINPYTRNPESGLQTFVYGPHEHARGGAHAFYDRTVAGRGDYALQRGLDIYVREVEKAT